jgi:hypothetical protein
MSEFPSKKPQSFEGLYAWFSIALSFVTNKQMGYEQFDRFFRVLADRGAVDVRRKLMQKAGMLEGEADCWPIAHAPRYLLESFGSSPENQPIVIRLTTTVSFAFGRETAQIDYHHQASSDSVVLWLGQGPFMEGPEGPYIQSRIDELALVGSELFEAGGFLVGLLEVEDAFTDLSHERLTRVPSINWTYWSGRIVSYVSASILDQAFKDAPNSKRYGDGGVLWVYAPFGEKPSPEAEDRAEALWLQLRDSLVNVVNGRQTTT